MVTARASAACENTQATEGTALQPLKISIAGEFWDSQIYSGRLYLFCLDGAIQTIRWDELVESWEVEERLRLALRCAFLRSDFLYGRDIQDLFGDVEIKTLLREKFADAHSTRLEVSPRHLAKHLADEQDNPCPFPHSDTELYYHKLYVGAPSGIVRATATGRTKHAISTRPERLWDCPVTGLSALYGQLAVAAADEGLFELTVGAYGRHVLEPPSRSPRRISARACTACEWVYHSVFASARRGGFLAAFEKDKEPGFGETYRRFDDIITAEELFGHSGYSWGVRDKLCQATEEGIKVVRYRPWEEEREQRFEELGIARIKPWKGEVISASAAPFGVVVELENAVVVYPSRGPSLTLRGEPTNWRVFPRSKHYENQLHVVYDDRLEIFSFNQDYLVDQERKLLGVSVRRGSQSRRRAL